MIRVRYTSVNDNLIAPLNLNQIVNDNLALRDGNLLAVANDRDDSFQQQINFVERLLRLDLLRDGENRVDEGDGEDAQHVEQQACVAESEVEVEDESDDAENDEVEDGEDVVEEDFPRPLGASFGGDVARAFRHALRDLRGG